MWTGGTDSHGYGIFWAAGTSHRAHIYSYKTFAGPVPADRPYLDHFACDRTSCVNWQHVRPSTPQENTLRSSTSPGALNAEKDKCPAGHDYDEANTRINGQGSRECIPCRRKQQRELKQAQRAVARGFEPLPAGTLRCLAGHALAAGNVYAFRDDGRMVCLVCTKPTGTTAGRRKPA